MNKYLEVLKSLKDKNIEELINILLDCMKEGFKGFNFPHNCCDFAVQFGGIVLKDLGYEVKAYHIFGHEHSYLVVDDKIIDFTIHQYQDITPGIIEGEQKNIYVNNVLNHDYTNFIQNVSYDDIKKDSLNFVNYVILMAMDRLISYKTCL